MLLFDTGRKLASETRIEYMPAARPSNEKAPRSSVQCAVEEFILLGEPECAGAPSVERRRVCDESENLPDNVVAEGRSSGGNAGMQADT
jgi:hypothetical protein